MAHDGMSGSSAAADLPPAEPVDTGGNDSGSAGSGGEGAGADGGMDSGSEASGERSDKDGADGATEDNWSQGEGWSGVEGASFPDYDQAPAPGTEGAEASRDSVQPEAAQGGDSSDTRSDEPASVQGSADSTDTPPATPDPGAVRPEAPQDPNGPAGPQDARPAAPDGPRPPEGVPGRTGDQPDQPVRRGDQPDEPNRRDQHDQPKRPGQSDQPDQPKRSGQSDQPDQPDQPERPGQPGKAGTQDGPQTISDPPSEVPDGAFGAAGESRKPDQQRPEDVEPPAGAADSASDRQQSAGTSGEADAGRQDANGRGPADGAGSDQVPQQAAAPSDFGRERALEPEPRGKPGHETDASTSPTDGQSVQPGQRGDQPAEAQLRDPDDVNGDDRSTQPDADPADGGGGVGATPEAMELDQAVADLADLAPKAAGAVAETAVGVIAGAAHTLEAVGAEAGFNSRSADAHADFDADRGPGDDSGESNPADETDPVPDPELGAEHGRTDPVVPERTAAESGEPREPSSSPEADGTAHEEDPSVSGTPDTADSEEALVPGELVDVDEDGETAAAVEDPVELPQPGLADTAPQAIGDADSGQTAAQEVAAGVDGGFRADEAEQLYAFGNKEAPRPVRLERDLELKDLNDIVGPFAPEHPTDLVLGASTFIDPQRAPITGKYHVLRPDAEIPPGLGVHADGEDVGGNAPWGHRTIYPTERMTAGRFIELVAGLDWEFVGDKPKGNKK